jgi:hypothetical protein
MPKIQIKLKEIGFDIDQAEYFEYKPGSSSKHGISNFFYDCYIIAHLFTSISNCITFNLNANMGKTCRAFLILEYLLKFNTEFQFSMDKLIAYLDMGNQLSDYNSPNDTVKNIATATDDAIVSNDDCTNADDYEIMSDQQWPCGKCTFLNDSDLRYCAMCKSHKLIDAVWG